MNIFLQFMADVQWKSISIGLPFIIRYLQHDIHYYAYCKQSKQQTHNPQWITVNTKQNTNDNSPIIHKRKCPPNAKRLALAQLDLKTHG